MALVSGEMWECNFHKTHNIHIYTHTLCSVATLDARIGVSTAPHTIKWAPLFQECEQALGIAGGGGDIEASTYAVWEKLARDAFAAQDPSLSLSPHNSLTQTSISRVSYHAKSVTLRSTGWRNSLLKHTMGSKFSHRLSTWTARGGGDRLSKSVALGNGDLPVQQMRPFTPPTVSTTTATLVSSGDGERNHMEPLSGEGLERHEDRTNSSSPEEMSVYQNGSGTRQNESETHQNGLETYQKELGLPSELADTAVDFELTVTPKIAIQQYVDKVIMLIFFFGCWQNVYF